MVGGPLHGQTQQVWHPVPHTLLVPRREDPISWATADEDPMMPMPEAHRYQLRWYKPGGSAGSQPAYLCTDPPAKIKLPDRPNIDEIRYAQTAETLWHEALEAALPQCVVPGCTNKGRYTFTAAERGRLAGRDWQPGDEIRICPDHGHDVLLAQGAYGMDQLAEWLKPDARWDPLDLYDSGADLLYGAEILARKARMLRIRRQR